MPSTTLLPPAKTFNFVAEIFLYSTHSTPRYVVQKVLHAACIDPFHDTDESLRELRDTVTGEVANSVLFEYYECA